jgi:hypothetical protein
MRPSVPAQALVAGKSSVVYFHWPHTAEHTFSGFTTVESDVAYIQKKSQDSIVPRKTSSNPIVASKQGSSANGAKKRAVKRPADDSEPEDVYLQANGGLSEEDDALERDAAISSPLKGTDHRGSAKVSSQFQRR